MLAQIYAIAREKGRGQGGDVLGGGGCVESFFARVKRSLNGIHHAVSRKHLHRYMTHMEFLHNYRDLKDGERTKTAIQSAEGKRLMYKEPVRH